MISSQKAIGMNDSLAGKRVPVSYLRLQPSKNQRNSSTKSKHKSRASRCSKSTSSSHYLKKLTSRSQTRSINSNSRQTLKKLLKHTLPLPKPKATSLTRLFTLPLPSLRNEPKKALRDPPAPTTQHLFMLNISGKARANVGTLVGRYKGNKWHKLC